MLDLRSVDQCGQQQAASVNATFHAAGQQKVVLTCVPKSYWDSAVKIAKDRPAVLSLLLLQSHIATFSRQRSVRINQKLIDKSPSIGSQVRRDIIELWRDSETARCLDRKDYVIKSRSLAYEHTTQQSANPHRERSKYRQANNISLSLPTIVAAPTLVPTRGMGKGYVAGAVVVGTGLGLHGTDCVWVLFDRGLADGALLAGAAVLGWDRVKLVAELGCEDLVDDCELDDAELATAARSAVVADGAPEEKVDRKVMAQLDAIKRFKSGKNSVRYSGGRIHNRLTLIPAWYRDRFVGFAGGTDRLDVRGCYPWLVSVDCLRQRRSSGDSVAIGRLERLCELIETGKLYETIAGLAGMETDNAKADFQRLCLFGKDVGHAHNRLWQAMMALSPEWCGYVLRQREQRAGASRLAHRLMRMEGALVCSGAAIDLAEDGIRAATIHDGIWVPAGRGEQAAMYIRKRANERYGRAPGLKIERVGRAVVAVPEPVVEVEPVFVRRIDRPVLVNEFEEEAF